ncbi:MAG TPA: DUF1588 domain-containing protein [Kofleriaceae bacterium]|nr:DUF1588 domain-containing protein [Kofleriaceae bacterium]
MRAAVATFIASGLALATAAGCVGHITGGDDAGEELPPDEPRNVCSAGEADVAGPRLLRRLTSREYTASVRAVFGLSAAEWTGPSLPADPAGRNGFTNNVDRLLVDESYAAALETTAEGVADALILPARLGQVLPCATAGGATCARTFLDTVGRRVYRRPLTDDERARYIALYERVSAQDDFATWVRWATVAMLSSPHFVYRSELGDRDGDTYRLTGYELATALSFAFTGAPPTDGLLDRAASGALDTPEGLASAARELALDPSTGRARPAMRTVFQGFTDQWLGLSSLANLVKSGEAFPGFTAEIRASMGRETSAFIDSVVFEQQGGVADLLTSPTSVVDASLAQFYGWPATGTGATTRPDGWGVGLLAQGSLLAINAGNTATSPTQRGALIRERLLCAEIPPPPPVVGDLPPPTGTQTTRQRYEQHTANPSCSGCHQLMDPIGFAFEHLDATGRYRATENGVNIDATGYIAGLEQQVTFDGPTELAGALAAESETAVCMASFMASSAFGLDHHDSECLVSSLADQLARDEITIVDFYVGLTSTRHFTRRTD